MHQLEVRSLGVATFGVNLAQRTYTGNVLIMLFRSRLLYRLLYQLSGGSAQKILIVDVTYVTSSVVPPLGVVIRLRTYAACAATLSRTTYDMSVSPYDANSRFRSFANCSVILTVTCLRSRMSGWDSAV